jgi:hypothetical protein
MAKLATRLRSCTQKSHTESGVAESFANNPPTQYVAERCGQFGPIDAASEFPFMPAPYDADNTNCENPKVVRPSKG